MDHEDHVEEKVESSKHEKDGHEKFSSPQVDRFTEFMFGPSVSRRTIKKGQHTHSIQDENQAEEVDYFTLMEQIDDIMDSLENLKPVLKQLSPIIDYLKKKI